jgi:hypothetical protein
MVLFMLVPLVIEVVLIVMGGSAGDDTPEV